MEGESRQDYSLPERLFGSDRYPDGRVNVYSRPEILSHVHTHLKGTDEWLIIKNSAFGKLFEIPVNMCYMSCKLLHSLLSRQVITSKKYELWTVYGGKPLKFSLAEFEALTGLPCGDFPTGYDYNSNPVLNDGEGSPWDRYIGPDKKIDLSDVANMLTRKDKIPPWRRLGLALLLIVEGVLIANHQGTKRITPKYVNMLGNVDDFMKFPWGRESFLKTISSMLPQRITTSTGEGGVSVFRKQMKQVSISLKGFPLALQLLAFRRIPALVEKIPNADDMRTILEAQFVSHANNAAVNLNSCLELEEDPKLALQELEVGDNAPNKLWMDEVVDSKVLYMEGLIREGYNFNVSHWPGGDMSLPIILRRQKGASSEIKKINRIRKGKAKTVKANTYCMDSSTERSKSEGANEIESLKKQMDEMNKAWVQKQKESEEKWARKYKKLRQRMRLWELNSGMQRQQIHKMSMQGSSTINKEKSLYSEYSGSTFPTNVKDYTFPTNEESSKVTIKEQLAQCNSKRKVRELNSVIEEKTILLKPKTGTTKRCKKRRPYSEFSTPTTPPHDRGYTFTKAEEVKSTKTVSDEDEPINENVPSFNDNKNEPHQVNFCLTPIKRTGGQVKDRRIVPFRPVYTRWSAEMDIPMEANIKVLFSDQNGEVHFSLPDIEFSDRDYSSKPIRKKRKAKCKERHCGHKKRQRKKKYCSGSDLETVDVSDGSPTRELQPSTFTECEEKVLNIFLCNSAERTFTIYPDLDNSTYYLLRSTLEKDPNRHYVTENQYSFDNKFLLALAKPSAWVDTQHMEMLMEMMGTMHAATMVTRRSCFLTPMFVNHIISHGKKFERSIDKSLFEWSSRIHNIVRRPGFEWLRDIDYVYLPMIWGNRHWVGLVVKLRTATIEVLDPDVCLNTERNVEKNLYLLRTALPFILDQCCSSGFATNFLNRRFDVVRTSGLYQNKRSGDCGPVTAKFLEMHAHGDVVVSGSTMTDTIVDDFRKQYLMDIYQHYILPLHMGRTA